MHFVNKILFASIIILIGYSINHNYDFNSFDVGFFTACGMIFMLDVYDLFLENKKKKMEEN